MGTAATSCERKSEWLGKLPKNTSGMEARAAMISTGLVVDDLDQAFQTRGWRDLETTRKSNMSDSRNKGKLTMTSLTKEIDEIVPSRVMRYSGQPSSSE